MRVICITGYNHPTQHRKIELLANAPDVEILNIEGTRCDRTTGIYPSADGKRTYTLKILPFHQFGKPGDPHRGIYLPLSSKLLQFKPDLIYCEHEQESLITLETVVLRRLLMHRVPLALYAWHNLRRRSSWLVRVVSGATLRAAQHIFCASTESIQVLRQKGYSGGASVVQQTGVDLRYFYPRPADDLQMRLDLGGFVVGFIGRLAPEKGVDTLLYAIAQLPLSIHTSVMIIGTGMERERLELLATRLGISKKCRFLGALPYDQIAEYMSAMNLLVLPSLTTSNWKEQFGRVLVEAMACGVNVAGSDSGAIPEVIGDAGLIFPEGAVTRLAKIIEELATHPDLCRAYAERGYQRVLQNYTTERVAEKTLVIWRHLVSSSHAGLTDLETLSREMEKPSDSHSGLRVNKSVGICNTQVNIANPIEI